MVDRTPLIWKPSPDLVAQVDARPTDAENEGVGRSQLTYPNTRTDTCQEWGCHNDMQYNHRHGKRLVMCAECFAKKWEAGQR